MKKYQEYLEKIGVPCRDAYDLPCSSHTFADGGHYRIEISGIERPKVLEAVIDEANKKKVPLHKLICSVMGATLLTKQELREMARIANEYKVEMIMTPGPRPLWDNGKQIATPEGALSGMRLRGSDQLNYYIADIFRCLDAGLRGFLVWDEGALWVLGQMKKDGIIPADTSFKVSIFAGHANAAGAKVLESLGATTFNPVADLSLPQLASIRQASKIPMDIHVQLMDSFGGFNRMWEAPEIARVCAPCYFKIEPGASVTSLYKPWVGDQALADMAREKVKCAEIIMEFMEENAPQLKISGKGASDLAVPKIGEAISK